MSRPSARLRSTVDGILRLVAPLPASAWERPASGLDWTCRETAAHLMDDFGAYALQLSGSTPPQTGYARFREPPPWTPGGTTSVFWPDPDAGTEGVVECLDAAAGLLCAVVDAAGPGKRGYHPHGISDASGFAAMGMAEATLHAHDILAAQGIRYAPEAGTATAILDRLFPDAARSEDPWRDLLAATGRTPETRGVRWHWDSSVR